MKQSLLGKEMEVSEEIQTHLLSVFSAANGTQAERQWEVFGNNNNGLCFLLKLGSPEKVFILLAKCGFAQYNDNNTKKWTAMNRAMNTWWAQCGMAGKLASRSACRKKLYIITLGFKDCTVGSKSPTECAKAVKALHKCKAFKRLWAARPVGQHSAMSTPSAQHTPLLPPPLDHDARKAKRIPDALSSPRAQCGPSKISKTGAITPEWKTKEQNTGILLGAINVEGTTRRLRFDDECADQAQVENINPLGQPKPQQQNQLQQEQLQCSTNFVQLARINHTISEQTDTTGTGTGTSTERPRIVTPVAGDSERSFFEAQPLPEGLDDPPSYINVTDKGLRATDVPPDMELKKFHAGEFGKLELLLPKGYKPTLCTARGRTTIILIPSRTTLMSQNELSVVKTNADIGLKVKNALKCYECPLKTGFSRQLLGATFAVNNSVSALAIEKIGPSFLYAFLRHAGVNISQKTPHQPRISMQDKCINFSPSRRTVERMIVDLAIDTLVIIKVSIDKARRYYLSFDKADGSKRCVKLISWWAKELGNIHYPYGQAMIIILDADHTGNSSDSVIIGLKHGLKKLCLAETTVAAGRTNDSGGGGGGASVDKPLRDQGILMEWGLGGNCGMHNLNLIFTYPMANTMNGIKGGLEARTAVQCTVAAYKFLEYLGKGTATKAFNLIIDHLKEIAPGLAAGNENGLVDEQSNELTILQQLIKEIQSDIASLDDTLNKLSKEGIQNLRMGVATRWWHIGTAILILLKNLPWWQALARVTVKTRKDSKVGKCAQDFLSLSKQPSLLSDLHLLAAIHTTFMVPHLKWMQRKDKLLKKAGFSSPNMFSRCFVMMKDIEAMAVWRDNANFKDFNDSLTKTMHDDPTQHQELVKLQKEKADEFMKLASEECKKMMHPWYNISRNAFLGAFSEQLIGRLVAQKLLGYSYCADPTKTIYNHAMRSWHNAPLAQPSNEQREESASENNHDGASTGNPPINNAVAENLPTVFSVVHERDINLRTFADWMDETISDDEAAENRRTNYHWKRHLHHFEAIACGLVDLWGGTTNDELTEKIRDSFLLDYGAFCTSQQMAERAVKMSNVAAAHHRGEMSASVRSLALALLKEVSK